tara:strand:- start:4644 stop:6620 length:1977 start_codon:yes stop_codon:yes gene_type:complete
MAVVSGTIMALKVLGKQALKSLSKQAIKSTAKKAVKGKIKDTIKGKIKDKIKSKFKKKKLKGKDVAQKMFGGGEEGGGAIVASPGGSLVGSPGGDLAPALPEKGGALVATKSSGAKELGLEPFMDSLTSVHTSVDAIKAALNDNNKDTKDRIDDNRILNDKLNKEEREAALESKKGGIGKKLMQPGKDMAEGFMSRIVKFFTATILGSFINALMGGAKDIILFFRVSIELLKKGMPNLLKGMQGLSKSIGKGLSLIARPFKGVANAIGSLFVKVGSVITGWLKNAFNVVQNTIKNIIKAGANAFPKIANAIGSGVKTVGNVINKGKDLVTGGLKKAKGFIKGVGSKLKSFLPGGKKAGSKILKHGIKGAGSRLIVKWFGKGAAKTLASVGKVLMKGAKAIKIPIIGPLLVAITSMFAGNPLDQVLFKTMGAALGGGIGLALGPIGMFVGEILGEFIGDVLYEGLRGKGWKAAAGKLKEKFMQLVKGGKKVVDWIGGGIGRFIKNVITTDPLPIPEGGGRRTIATKLAKFIGLYDWLAKQGFAGGKDGQIDKFPNFLNILFPWKSAGILVKSFFPPGEEKEGGDQAQLGDSDSNTDAEDVSEETSYEEGSGDTVVLDGGSEGEDSSPISQGGQGGSIILASEDTQDPLNTLTNATLYKI